MLDPKNRQIVESMTMNPAERKLLKTSILEVIKGDKLFENVSPQKATVRINNLLADQKMSDKILRNYQAKKDALAVKNKQVAAKPAKPAKML